MKLVVDLTVTDRTNMALLGRDVTRQLERIVGVSVYKVSKVKEESP